MELVKRDCAICSSSNIKQVYEQPTYFILGIGDIHYVHRIAICKECGFVFASPILPSEVISQYYRRLSNYENPQYGGENSPEDKSKFDRTHKFIKSRLPAGFKGKALDIGCGVAFGLSLFQLDGWEVTGLDPSPKCAELSRELYGVRVETGMYNKEALVSEGPYDLIILSHVLEHVSSPDLLTHELREILARNGLLYIEVPNLLRPYVPVGYFTFEHLNYFTPITLTSLMEKNGFSADHLETFDNSADIHPFYPVIASTWKMTTTTPSPRLRNDYVDADRIIEKYREESQQQIERLQARIDLILATVKPGRLGVWGAGIHTSQLLSLTALSRASLACIFDNDTKKHGARINGVEVVPFPGHPEQVNALVDAIVISSKASENEIYKQLSYLKEFGIEVYKLYDV